MLKNLQSFCWITCEVLRNLIKYSSCRQIQLTNLQQETFVSIKTKLHQKITRPQRPYFLDLGNFHLILSLLVQFLKFIKYLKHRRLMKKLCEKVSCRKLKCELNNVDKAHRFLKRIYLFRNFRRIWTTNSDAKITGFNYAYFWLNWRSSRAYSSK